MIRVPNAAQAYIDEQKLQNYTLNPEHAEGKHKARVFAAALGITQEHVDLLSAALVAAVQTQNATLGRMDEYGQRYTVDFQMEGLDDRVARVRSAWMIRKDEDFPRFVTAYVIEE
jgi:oligoribonuclease (3'-5' exoribonuclease)